MTAQVHAARQESLDCEGPVRWLRVAAGAFLPMQTRARPNRAAVLLVVQLATDGSSGARALGRESGSAVCLLVSGIGLAVSTSAGAGR
jgi:hypothetical protein